MSKCASRTGQGFRSRSSEVPREHKFVREWGALMPNKEYGAGYQGYPRERILYGSGAPHAGQGVRRRLLGVPQGASLAQGSGAAPGRKRRAPFPSSKVHRRTIGAKEARDDGNDREEDPHGGGRAASGGRSSVSRGDDCCTPTRGPGGERKGPCMEKPGLRARVRPQRDANARGAPRARGRRFPLACRTARPPSPEGCIACKAGGCPAGRWRGDRRGRKG